MPNDEVKLSGCPFCGKGDFVRVRRYEFPADEEGPAWKWGYHVICDAAGIAGTCGCGCSSGWAETAAEAIEAWNRRAIPSTVSGETKERLPVMSATAVEDELSGKLVWDCHEIDGRDGEQMPVVELAAETFAVGTTIQIFEPGRGEVS